MSSIVVSFIFVVEKSAMSPSKRATICCQNACFAPMDVLGYLKEKALKRNMKFNILRECNGNFYLDLNHPKVSLTGLRQ